MTTKILVAILALLLVGCHKPTWVNQERRRAIFMECLKSVPAGPTEAKYNDWNEVVTACESSAYYQSIQKTPCDNCLTIR